MRNEMKRRILFEQCRLVIVLEMMTLLLLSPGCRKDHNAEEKTLKDLGQKPAETTKVKQEKEPTLGLMVNRLGEIDTYPGWPVLVELEVRHPLLFQRDRIAESLPIASRRGPWSEAPSLSVMNSKDEALDFPFRLMAQKEATLLLDTKHTAIVTWWLTGEDTTTIPDGDYRINATLDTLGVLKLDAWLGKVQSNSVLIHMKKEPSALSKEQAEEKQLLLAASARALGDRAKAREYIDALLATQPESIQGLALKAGLLEETGDRTEAMVVYEKAISVFNRKYPDADPPYELLEPYHKLVIDLLKK
jgi:hypothetical protein